MNEVRNLDGRLVCCVDAITNTIEIKIKDCITTINFDSEGITKIVNLKT